MNFEIQKYFISFPLCFLYYLFFKAKAATNWMKGLYLKRDHFIQTQSNGGNINLIVANLAVLYNFPFERVFLVSYSCLTSLWKCWGVKEHAHSKIVRWKDLVNSILQFPSLNVSYLIFYITLPHLLFLFILQSRHTAFMLSSTHSFLCILPDTEKLYDKFSLIRILVIHCESLWVA